MVLQQCLQVAEDLLGLSQCPAFRQTTHRQLLSHLQDVSFGDRGLHDVGASRFTGYEFVIFHAGIPVQMSESAGNVERGVTG